MVQEAEVREEGVWEHRELPVKGMQEETAAAARVKVIRLVVVAAAQERQEEMEPVVLAVLEEPEEQVYSRLLLGQQPSTLAVAEVGAIHEQEG